MHPEQTLRAGLRPCTFCTDEYPSPSSKNRYANFRAFPRVSGYMHRRFVSTAGIRKPLTPLISTRSMCTNVYSLTNSVEIERAREIPKLVLSSRECVRGSKLDSWFALSRKGSQHFRARTHSCDRECVGMCARDPMPRHGAFRLGSAEMTRLPAFSDPAPSARFRFPNQRQNVGPPARLHAAVRHADPHEEGRGGPPTPADHFRIGHLKLRLLTPGRGCSVTAALPLASRPKRKTPYFPVKQRDAGGLDAAGSSDNSEGLVATGHFSRRLWAILCQSSNNPLRPPTCMF